MAQLSKMSRIRKRLGKLAWRLTHRRSTETTPVFVFGLQRSGTSTLMDCLDMSPELQCFTEARNSAAFDNFRFRSDEVVRDLIAASPYRAIAFKPLIESHRAREFMAAYPQARGIWVYRRAADRANSSVRKFGPHNLDVLKAIARGEQLDSWHAQGISEEGFALLREFDYETMNAETAAALFWYVRNKMYFEQEFFRDPRIMLLAYEQFVQQPAATIEALCAHIGIRFRPHMVAHIHARSIGKRPSDLAPRVGALCDALYEEFEKLRRSLPEQPAADLT